jgi:hypothetical protein
MPPMTTFGRPPEVARPRDLGLVLVATFQAGTPARRRGRRVTRPRWLPIAAISSAIGGVVFAVWLFSTLTG